MRVLNDEEISLALRREGYTDEVFGEHETVAKAQHQQDLKYFIELLDNKDFRKAMVLANPLMENTIIYVINTIKESLKQLVEEK